MGAGPSVITSCTTPGVVALTFDDGPFAYTDQLLNTLGAAGAKVTFFVNGNNWASIYDYQSTIQRMVNEGHQVGSHTWSHADLVTLDTNGVTAQMTDLEAALLNIIGKYPAYMRPPYFSFNDAVLDTLHGLDYKVVDCDIDTLDWQYNTPDGVSQSQSLFESGLNSGGSLILSHDVQQTTVELLVPRMLSILASRGLRSVTVGECLGDDPANWYHTSRNGGGGTAPPGTATPDGTCGPEHNYVCPAGECCSQYNWCGVTAEHCTAGCNSAFGTCW